MNTSEKPNLNDYHPDSFRSGYLILVFASVLALLLTLLFSNLALSFEVKIAILGVIIGVYLIFCIGFYFRQNHQKNHPLLAPETEEIDSKTDFAPEIEEKLHVLEEANLFFGSSLKIPDMFRLVSKRIEELIPFATCVLFLADRSKTKLKVAQAFGVNAAAFSRVETNSREGLAGEVFLSKKVQVDEELLRDKKVITPDALKNLNSSIAVPLLRDELEVFGVLALYGDQEKAFDSKTAPLLKAISSRISPLFLSSMTFERNLENALTDTLTNLPNERAFYLVLENQIAEAQRFREQRSLTVLSVDIKNFDELNKKFGHALGDQVLTFTAKIIKGQLRQMDFLARSSSDEFLAVLPTASEEITKVIIERIEKAFAANAFELPENQKEYIKLNFGAATFVKDGETAEELLNRAVLKKQQNKSAVNGQILWFPREYVN
jgi:diguanylate cyclase (GGDEF)-like protein